MDSVYEGEKRMSKMTLDDAIIHAKELSESQSVCEDCREEHKQLAEWLEELNEYKNIFGEEHPLDGNSANFLHFKMYSNSTLERMTKDWLIEYINILMVNWKNTDNTCERVSRLAKQLYEKSNLYKTALELYISWADVYGFGYRQVTNEYPEYQGDIKEMDWPDNLVYVAIQKAKEKLEHENKC